MSLPTSLYCVFPLLGCGICAWKTEKSSVFWQYLELVFCKSSLILNQSAGQFDLNANVPQPRACSASIARLYYSIQLSVTGDLSYYMLGACLWAYAEIWIGLLCCCLPVLPKFVKIVGPRLSQTLTSKYTLGTSKGSTIHSTGPYRSVLSDSKVDSGRADDDIEMGGWQPGNARGTFSVDIEGNYSQSDLEPCVKNGRIMQTVQIEIENAGTKSPKPSRYTFLRD